ncbi:hypothetical protein TNCV_1169121 [Trichonephila clavipes]|uniref:Uncharacterized protein n=1 Tax=Trichonephila clavipes TaxID=2585209 RepID=A0A8X6T8W1_TRICX|nr:hypothetical protein TNCV_1169121 [Trichonephila clavipes]
MARYNDQDEKDASKFCKNERSAIVIEHPGYVNPVLKNVYDNLRNQHCWTKITFPHRVIRSRNSYQQQTPSVYEERIDDTLKKPLHQVTYLIKN